MTEALDLREVRILWPNFSGSKTLYNAEGNRNFTILIEDEKKAAELAAAGWNIKEREPYEEGDSVYWTLSAKVNYGSKWPPRIYKVNADGTTKLLLDESTVKILDLLRIEYADVLLNPYAWSAQGRTGISAYVDTMYVVTEQNPLDIKWEQKAADSALGEE